MQMEMNGFSISSMDEGAMDGAMDGASDRSESNRWSDG
jgi:hypothetical protein